MESALKIDPNLTRACNDLVWIYVTGPAVLRNPKKALALAQRAVRIPPEDTDRRNTLGVVLYRLGQFDGAVDSLRQAIHYNRGEATAHDLFFLAMSYHQLGENEQTRKCYDRALHWW